MSVIFCHIHDTAWNARYPLTRPLGVELAIGQENRRCCRLRSRGGFGDGLGHARRIFLMLLELLLNLKTTVVLVDEKPDRADYHRGLPH